MKREHEIVLVMEGLAVCTVCKGGEGSLTTDCKGKKLEPAEEALVLEGKLDYVDGNWIVPSKEEFMSYRIDKLSELEWSDINGTEPYIRFNYKGYDVVINDFTCTGHGGYWLRVGDVEFELSTEKEVLTVLNNLVDKKS